MPVPGSSGAHEIPAQRVREMVSGTGDGAAIEHRSRDVDLVDGPGAWRSSKF
jgi:hypothetical protein